MFEYVQFFSSVLLNIIIISLCRAFPTLRLEYQHRCALDVDCLFGRSALLLLLLSIFMFFHQHLLNNNNRLSCAESQCIDCKKTKKKKRGGKKKKLQLFFFRIFPFRLCVARKHSRALVTRVLAVLSTMLQSAFLIVSADID